MKLKHKTCKQAARLTSEKIDRPLTFGERIGLYIHYLLCKPCVKYQQQLELLHRLGRSHGDNDPSGPSMRLSQLSVARIRGHLAREISG